MRHVSSFPNTSSLGSDLNPTSGLCKTRVLKLCIHPDLLGGVAVSANAKTPVIHQAAVAPDVWSHWRRESVGIEIGGKFPGKTPRVRFLSYVVAMKHVLRVSHTSYHHLYRTHESEFHVIARFGYVERLCLESLYPFRRHQHALHRSIYLDGSERLTAVKLTYLQPLAGQIL
jgi:hypothetical protein